MKKVKNPVVENIAEVKEPVKKVRKHPAVGVSTVASAVTQLEVPKEKAVKNTRVRVKHLAPEMKAALIKMLQVTWNVIGDDILQAAKAAGIKDGMPREDVITLVLDAGHPYTHGSATEAVKAIFSRIYPNGQRILGKLAFPAKSYSL